MWQVAWAHPKFGSILASCSYDRKVIIWKETAEHQWIQVKSEDFGAQPVRIWEGFNPIRYFAYGNKNLEMHLGVGSLASREDAVKGRSNQTPRNGCDWRNPILEAWTHCSIEALKH